MNELISRLKKMHGEWLKASQLAMAAMRDEHKAKCIAADKFSVQLMEMIPEIVQRMQKLERQKYFLAMHLSYCCTTSKCPASLNESCPLSIESDIFGNDCRYVNPENWIQASEVSKY